MTASTDQSITRITMDEFVQQGIDIVHAYANDCHLSIVFPEHSPAQLAEWIWKRRADKNGTIPVLPQHVAVRLSNGQLRIINRKPGEKRVPGPTVDEVDCPPTVPPDLDESQPLPAPFLRFKQEELHATGTSSQDEEEFDFPTGGFPLERFPSPPNTHSPPTLPIRNFVSPDSSRSSERETPELDIVYPPRGRTILGLDGQVIGEEKVSSRWLDDMLQQVRNKRQRLKRTLEDSQVELAHAVMEMQKAKSDLDSSVSDSRQTLERLKRLFGTKRVMKVLDVVRLGRKGKLRRTYFDNVDAAEDVSRNRFSQDDDSSDSQPVTWSSRPDSEPATNDNESTVAPNHASSSNDQTQSRRDDATNTSNKENKQVSGVATSQNTRVNEGQGSNSSRPLNSQSPRASRKRARDDVDDSETEVELSVLYDHESDSVKRRRLNAARPLPGTKSQVGGQENRNAGNQGRRSNQRARSEGITKDRRPKREPVIFLSSPSPFRLRHIPEKDRAKFAPMIARFGLDKDEPECLPSPRPRPGGHQQMRISPDTPHRRPLKRSTSGIIPYEGGHLYVKHYS